jgi:dynein heavy chain
LATAIKEVGIYYNQTALYLSEPQIRSETFLEDINNLINSGEVPGLLTKEDNELIVRELSA